MRENEHRVMAAPPAVPVPGNNEGRAKQQCLDEQFPSGAASLADELPLHSVNRRMFELSQIGRQNLVHPIRYFFWCLCGVSGQQKWPSRSRTFFRQRFNCEFLYTVPMRRTTVDPPEYPGRQSFHYIMKPNLRIRKH